MARVLEDALGVADVDGLVGLAAPLGADVARVTGAPPTEDEASFRAMFVSMMLVIALIVGTLGSIWLGLCTPTEGAGIGAVGSLIWR